ncbi:hypothetical protein AK812_SmicGene35563 [Symbiodinium microadriaticum]|uniref:USP domain-containing protein n=1 Tax=Symbiodinium microadriaticum TaxID=2951 RepID=A0A1Q9CL44_SYMMI|nr:hypothetical protein AK812_SmicGene35563 [Symbiodinium microadriaticum]
MVAEGMQEPDMLRVIADEEGRNPPILPEGAAAQVDIQAAVARALTVSPDQLGARGVELRILSKSRMPVNGALSATFPSPCSFCGSVAKKASDHCVKCSALFQLLAHLSLVRGGWQGPSAQRGPSLKQWQVSATYKQFKPELTPIGRFLSFKGRGEQQETGEPLATVESPPTKQPPRSADSYERLAQSRGPGGAVVSLAVEGSDWVGRVVLANSNNLCYLNAAFLSLLHCSDFVMTEHRGVQALRRIGALGLSHSRGLLLTSQLQLQIRSILGSWSFDGPQHDVAEFAAVLLRGLGLGSAIWEARRHEDEATRALHSGSLPLLMPPPAQECMYGLDHGTTDYKYK